MSLICRSRAERGKAHPDAAVSLRAGREREPSKRRTREELSTDAVVCWRTGS